MHPRVREDIKKRHFLSHLWRLVVHRHHSDVEADPSDCFAQAVCYGENQLDVLRVRTDVHDRRHVGYFHEVHCMLETNRKGKLCISSSHCMNGSHIPDWKSKIHTCVKSLSTGVLGSLVNLGMLSTKNNLPASGLLDSNTESRQNVFTLFSVQSVLQSVDYQG